LTEFSFALAGADDEKDMVLIGNVGGGER
jgi:hypothetical protein